MVLGDTLQAGAVPHELLFLLAPLLPIMLIDLALRRKKRGRGALTGNLTSWMLILPAPSCVAIPVITH